MKISEVKAAYGTWAAAHPWGAGLVVTAEGAAIGALTDMMLNGADFSKNGLRHAGTIMLATVIAAVRNYLKDSPKQVAAAPKQ
jgi:hypothetical protein